MKRGMIGLSLVIGMVLVMLPHSMAIEEPLAPYYPSYDQSIPPLPSNYSPSRPPTTDNYDFIYQKAQPITVKVLSGQTSGSGVLVKKQGSTYWVLTNHHVIVFGQQQQNYRIIAPDGQKYPARLFKIGNGQDLAILRFNSQNFYQIAPLSASYPLQLGEEVFAVGFPAEDQGGVNHQLIISRGTIARLNTKTFGGGYQIGYTSLVKKGMSGGALFNRNGEIIGINGVHKYPLWGNPYVFADGSRANPTEKQQMSQYSWAIPLQTMLQMIF